MMSKTSVCCNLRGIAYVHKYQRYSHHLFLLASVQWIKHHYWYFQTTYHSWFINSAKTRTTLKKADRRSVGLQLIFIRWDTHENVNPTRAFPPQHRIPKEWRHKSSLFMLTIHLTVPKKNHNQLFDTRKTDRSRIIKAVLNIKKNSIYRTPKNNIREAIHIK